MKSQHIVLKIKAELKCVMFFHFLFMDHLLKLIEFVCPDSHIAAELKISRTKATFNNKTMF